MRSAALAQRATVLALVLLPMLTLSGCQTLREIANLRNVRFVIDNVADVRLAGIDVTRVRSFSDLGPLDIARLTAAIARNELPLDFQLVLSAENPADNPVDARLVQMDWTLLLEDRETISGTFNENVVLRPGQPTPLAFGISLDLIRFFDSNASDLFELVQAIGGQGGAPKKVSLRATPTIDTAIGPIRYPEPITILSREVGS